MGRPYLLPHVLDASAERHGTRRAFTLDDETWNYGELALAAGRWAGLLCDLGVGRGDRVVLHLPKSPRAVAAAYGAMRAGACHVPVDPAAPTAVLEKLVDEAEAGVVIVDEERADRVTELLGTTRRVLSTGARGTATAGWSDLDAVDPAPCAPALGDDPAYVIFTSGSTGRPKGIVHSHRSALRYAELAASTYDLGPDDRLANVAPFHFDQSTFELYAGPLAGASVVLVSEFLPRFPAELARLIERERPTVWYSVPTILVHLVERGGVDEHDLSSLRWVLYGGEVFPPRQLGDLMRAVPGARVSNVYGPAEVNQCTFHHLDAPPDPDERIPIGAAWADTEVMIESDGETIDGPGTGELLVRSSTMMTGYLGRPDLTDAAIVDRSHDGIAGRWYRTGDLVTRDDGGLLHFEGRVDRQVKVRGNRVELEAVEMALCDVDGVTRAAAVVHEGMLVALVESDAGELDPRAVRRNVATRLASAAVPDRIIVVGDLPRTASGKVDAGAAAALVRSTADTEVSS